VIHNWEGWNEPISNQRRNANLSEVSVKPLMQVSVFYGSLTFISMCTRAHHWSLSPARFSPLRSSSFRFPYQNFVSAYLVLIPLLPLDASCPLPLYCLHPSHLPPDASCPLPILSPWPSNNKRVLGGGAQSFGRNKHFTFTHFLHLMPLMKR
jgi:hypothetical protein